MNTKFTKDEVDEIIDHAIRVSSKADPSIRNIVFTHIVALRTQEVTKPTA